jgi:hypothetical protein
LAFAIPFPPKRKGNRSCKIKMKYLLALALFLHLFVSCKHKKKIDHFSGKWEMISLVKDGKPDTESRKDTLNGVLKVTDKDKGLYFFQIFDTRFLLKQTDTYHLEGTNFTVFIRYLPETGHIIFDMENDASIMEFKKLQ